jgi:Protein  of unknown function (DUF3018)
MAATVSERVRTRRDNLRAAGLRPIQIWVPDTRRPGFAEECARQSEVIRQNAAAEKGDMDFMEKLIEDEWE